MDGHFDLSLVALSFVVAVVASYTALELARRVSLASGVPAKIWLISGAISMGIGIWTMHFVGMLAFSMDMPFSYNVPITFISLLVGIGASAFAIHIGSQKNVGARKIGLSGIVLGAGIASMHYTGMVAMEMNATINYDPMLFSASIVIAVVAATAAIWIAFTLSNTTNNHRFVLQLTAAMIMGIAICGMHYTGMFAANYNPADDVIMSEGNANQHTWLAVSLGIAALVILGITHLTIFFDYKLTAERKIGEAAEQKAIRLSEILDDSSNEIYIVNMESVQFLSVNKGAEKNTGYSRELLEQMTLFDLQPEFTRESFRQKLQQFRDCKNNLLELESTHQRKDGSTYPVHMSLQRSAASTDAVFIAIIADVTERRNLEEQVAQSRKLESIGQLAAGIAHEINTPAQFVGDNTRFLKDSFTDLDQLLIAYASLYEAVRTGSATTNEIKSVEKAIDQADPDYLREEIPSAIDQSLDGISRISKIVLAMKEFSHPGGDDKELVDINKIIANTIVVASNEWKYIADLTEKYDDQLLPVPCHPQEISQVILNLVVNAAHAIADKAADQSAEKGHIQITTCQEANGSEIRITDSGCGIPEANRARVFDPFFTTKEVGKGTGQGLSMAYSTIVDKHNGSLKVESEVGVGTTFIIFLPASASTSVNMDKAA